jgi:hypothetical protein
MHDFFGGRAEKAGGLLEHLHVRLRAARLIGKYQRVKSAQQTIPADHFSQHPPRRIPYVRDDPKTVTDRQLLDGLSRAGDQVGRPFKDPFFKRLGHLDHDIIREAGIEQSQRAPQPLRSRDRPVLVAPNLVMLFSLPR